MQAWLVVALAAALACLAHAQKPGRFLSLPVPQKCANRPKEFFYRGHNYFYSGHVPALANRKVDWLDGRNICREYCMDLVSMETQEENNLIFKLIQQNDVPYIWTSGRLCDFKGCESRKDLEPKNILGWFWSANREKISPTNQADNTYFINKKGKYCSYCGRYTIRVSTTCPHCRANWSRRLGRCRNCEAAIDPEWSYCEICGVETARAQRLKRAKMLSHRAKLQKVAHTQLPPPPQHCPKSPDLFGPDPDMDEVESFESTLSSDQQSRTTPPTNSTNVSDDTENDVVADIREN